MDLSKIRNIGISAHIDSGKTTLTERILFYCNKIHAIHEVRGKDGVGATMDSMELERERGITIASAATSVTWKENYINIIDTPGHVDFTIEVERALRVLDGAIAVFCSVAGVQSQSITVDRQLKRYSVPRLAFVNKCDRTGANPLGVALQLKEKLALNPVLMQYPIGLEDLHEGMIDLVTMKAYMFEGEDGTELKEVPVPADLLDIAKEKRDELLDAISHFSDEIMELMLEEQEVPLELIYKTVREATIALKMVPVFLGSAYKNKGVQLLLDAVSAYLPAPTDVPNIALDLANEEKEVLLETNPEKPTVALGFKLEDGQYGQLTYVRVYQGSLKKGQELINTRSRKKFKVGRLIKMHANTTEDIEESFAGDIVALFGIECASGDTFCDSNLDYSMTSMFVPEPVISLSIKPKDKKSADNISKALNRFTKEDPTFRSFVDQESNETIIQGMGELHLEVYVERMKREYKAEVETGAPQVAYREAITAKAEFNYTHKKQSGGSGQYGRVAGFVEPITGEDAKDFEFVNQIKGGVIPTEYIPAVEKGFITAQERGQLIGFPVVGVRVVLQDGQQHDVDSSDMAFQLAAIGAFRDVYAKAKPAILEPIMRVMIEGPIEFQGSITGSIPSMRGMIVSTDGGNETFFQLEADVPLSEMFGYSTRLRSMSQGKAEFSMEFSKYAKVPNSIEEELKKKFVDRRKG